MENTNDKAAAGKVAIPEEASRRLRDEKGHFISNPDTACTHDKKPKRTRKQKEDANTVKIRIVKDEVPPPGKDFEGRLEDMKERTATNFLKSVCYHKPRVINIDGMRYYSKSVVETLAQKYSVEKAVSAKGLDMTKKAVNTLLDAETTIERCANERQKVRKSRFVWRSVAIGALAALVTFAVTSAITKRIVKAHKATAPVEQVQPVGK